MANSNAARSVYYNSLDGNSKARYDEILSFIAGIDPYTINPRSWSADATLLPSLTYPDIVNFLVHSPSPYTLEDLRCYKGLEAYNQFVVGWVRDVVATVINDRHVVSAKVRQTLEGQG